MNGSEANQRFIKMTVVEEHVEYYDDSGQFLPLSVWAAQGWGPEAIRLNCQPVIGDQAASSSDSSSSSSGSSSSKKRSKKSKTSKKSKKESKKEKKGQKEKELKRKRDAEEAKASVSPTACVGDYC